jgi:hypothetical protein
VNAASAEPLRAMEQGRLALLNAVESGPLHLQSTRPGEDRWSVAEVLEHLSVVERRSSLLLKNIIRAVRNGTGTVAGAPAASAAHANFSTTALLDRTRKITAAPSVQPTGSVAVDSSLQSLGASRAELKALIIDANDQIMGSHAFDHPAFGPLNVRQWIEFLLGHEARHTAQILEIGVQLNGAE